MVKADDIIRDLQALKGCDEKRRILSSFFKTGKGQYAEGDVMLGVTVPNTRSVAKKYADSSTNLLAELLQNEIHEVRLCALLIMVEQANKALRVKDADVRTQIQQGLYELYLNNAERINNWDLVDLSAPQIVGQHLLERKDRSVLYELAGDKLLWRRRIAVVSTLKLIRNGQFDDTLCLVRKLVGDPEDLMRKAMGWMLREIGKKDESVLRKFLDETVTFLPRTTLRYAIERFTPELRKYYMMK